MFGLAGGCLRSQRLLLVRSDLRQHLRRNRVKETQRVACIFPSGGVVMDRNLIETHILQGVIRVELGSSSCVDGLLPFSLETS